MKAYLNISRGKCTYDWCPREAPAKMRKVFKKTVRQQAKKEIKNNFTDTGNL